MLANAYLTDNTPTVDLLNPQSKSITNVGSRFMTVTVPAKSARVPAPKERGLGGYSRYKRVKSNKG